MTQLKADMAGTVKNIMVDVGDSVIEGQEIIMMESMKMLIPLESEAAGRVIEIRVKVGDFVNEGDVLFILR